MNSPNEDKYKQSRFSFQYFDEACDVGVQNEFGELVRKRKRPGRKPNPPSQQERREQNRVAQRNFREREQQRRQEREKEWQQYMDELASVRQRLAIAEYEANYLRGWILQLLLASIAQRGTVPQTWVDTRRHPIPHPTMVPTPTAATGTDETAQLPPMLQLVLDDHSGSIMGMKKALEVADGSSPSCPLARRAHHARSRQQQYQQRKHSVNSNSNTSNTEVSIALPPSAVTPCQYKSIQELLSTDIVSINTNSQDVRRTFPLWIPNQHQQLQQQITTPPLSTTSSHGIASPDIDQQQQHNGKYPAKSSSPPSSFDYLPPSVDPEIESLSPPPPPSIFPPLPTQPSSKKGTQSVKGTIFEPPTLKRPEDLSHMPTTQAHHILRLQLKIGSVIGEKIQYALTPTALQRVVAHDVRIDYVPAGSIRDRMIVFQDYFDMDDCFQLLCSHSMFVGGDIRDCRNWVLDPCITEKYWFFSHHLYDHHFDDCHMPEEFADVLKEWSIQQQQQQQQQPSTTHETATSHHRSSSTPRNTIRASFDHRPASS